MDEFRGIILYTIELDGNLNGVYTNNHPQTRGQIFTETARLNNHTFDENGTEIIVYDSVYFDPVDNRVDCSLTFRISNRIYEATWVLENGFVFTGQGFRMNDRQIAIIYWNI